jgi:uncharacterized protein (DUF2062 family)
MKMALKRTLRYFYLRFIRLRGTPYSLAMGAAFGAAIAVTPTMPLHTVIIIGVTVLLRINTIAALIAGTIVSNPFTFAAQYYVSWKIGDAILPHRLTWERLQQVIHTIENAGFMEGVKILSHLSYDAILVMLTGGIILAIPLGLATYLLSYRFFVHLEEKRKQKHILK